MELSDRYAVIGRDSASPSGESVEDLLYTHFYNLDVKKIRLTKFEKIHGSREAAAMEPFADHILIASIRGKFALMDRTGSIVYLDESVPINYSEFIEIHGQDGRKSMRVGDILIRPKSEDRFDLFVTHHYWTGTCIVFRLSQTEIVETAGELQLSPSWRTIFDASPCLDTPSDTFQAGGRIILDGENHLLISIGDHGQDGWQQSDQFVLSDNLDSHMGKLVRITLENGDAEILTIGHRNPQGLVRDDDGNIWSTEHGPQGGDELNLLIFDPPIPLVHYGWPRVTYGIDYGGKIPPHIAAESAIGSHEGYMQPAFSWVPSEGISPLAVNDPQAFPLWKNDLLAGSLGDCVKGCSIHRIRRQGTEVKYVEKIRIGDQVRDIKTWDGGIVLLINYYPAVYILSKSSGGCGDAAPRNRSVYTIHCPDHENLEIENLSDVSATPGS